VEYILTKIGLKNVDSLIVSQPKYMTTLESVLKKIKYDWKAYMRWSLLNRASSQLSTTIENANFEFYGKTLTGAVKQRPSDERALVINGRIGKL
jgi:endothelin-converting enzyme/putative endopeptidase